MKIDSELSTYINVKYEWTDKLNTVKEWLSNIKEPTVFDFEVAPKYYQTEKNEVSIKFKNNKDIQDTDYKIMYCDGLSNCYDTVLTHLGFSNKEDKGYVIVMLNKEVRDYVLNYLVTSDILQIYHKAEFDFKHILFYTNKFPKNYVDTRQLVKNKINNVDNFKGSTKLEVLMSKYYGKWKTGMKYIIENAYNDDIIEYTAKDVCATYKLYKLLKYNKE